MTKKNGLMSSNKGLLLKHLKLNEIYRCRLSNKLVIITLINDDETLKQFPLKERVTAKYYNETTGEYAYFHPIDNQLQTINTMITK